MQKSYFHRHPKVTVFTLCALLALIILGTFEVTARVLWGLGNPVVYDMNPLYGYRPLPHQYLTRNQGAMLSFNNLGLRANIDWDNNPYNKVLFLGDSVTYGGSYISNDALFSFLSVKTALPQYESGNAGVNGWGVLNILGLVRDAGFLPAKIIVTVLPEGDFLRGLNRIAGQPFWPKKPSSALEELWYFSLYQLNLKKFDSPAHTLTESEKEKIVLQAAHALKILDETIRAQGAHHLIYITPSREQALGLSGKDPIVVKALQQAGVQPHYLLDNLLSETFSPIEVQSFYVDPIHLSQQGHVQWAKWIAADLIRFVPT